MLGCHFIETSEIINVPSRNPNALANLKPFKKGQSGNPDGRPKRLGFIGEIIRQHLQQPTPEGKQRIDEFVERLYKEDLKTYAAYGFGKPIETQVQIDDREQDKEFAKQVARELIKTAGESIESGSIKVAPPHEKTPPAQS